MCVLIFITEVCKLPPVVGDCDATFRRYFFNRISQSCEVFTYGGCGGNANNFAEKEDCIRTCRPCKHIKCIVILLVMLSKTVIICMYVCVLARVCNYVYVYVINYNYVCMCVCVIMCVVMFMYVCLCQSRSRKILLGVLFEGNVDLFTPAN